MKTRLSETLRERAWSSPVWIVQGRRAFNIAKVNVNSTEMQGTARTKPASQTDSGH